jgi:hypothetical protein
MARGIARLRVADLQTKQAGLKCDGGNLYLRIFVSESGHVSRSWIFRYQLPGGKLRDMGLGSLNTIGLAKARELAREYRELLASGVDPIEHRNSKRAQAAATISVPNFNELTNSYLAAHRPGWRNPLHAKHWGSFTSYICIAGHWKTSRRHDHHRSRVKGA